MSHLKLLKIPLTGFFIGLLFTSCFKDVDLGQAPDIALTPDLEADILVYQLNENDFIDSETGAFTPVIRDTVRLEFLNDDYIQESLLYAAFRFRHENSFSQPIQSRIKFLSNTNQNQFSVNYKIPAGTAGALGIVDTLQVMEGGDIVKVRRSIQMVVELEMIGGGKDIEGELNFLSKGLFKFEF